MTIHSPLPGFGSSSGRSPSRGPGELVSRTTPEGGTGDETGLTADEQSAAAEVRRRPPASADLPKEVGGPSGPEPTRYGDWERNGRCYDF